MKKIQYRDFDLKFKAHPVTGNLITVTDVDAIKQSVKNIIMTNIYEKLFNRDFFTNVTYSLFENVDSADLTIIKNKIKSIISNYENRAEILDVRIEDDLDTNSYRMTIIFIPQNALESTQLDIILERTR